MTDYCLRQGLREAVERGKAGMEEMCSFNVGLTCEEVKSNGSGHCCREYDTTGRLELLSRKYREMLKSTEQVLDELDLPF